MSLARFALVAGALGVAGVLAMFVLTWPRGAGGDDPLPPGALLQSASPAAAGNTPAGSTVPASGANPDAVEYARAMGVSIEEAERRLAAQESLGDLSARIAAVAPDRHSGTWIEHEPTWSLVVAFTGGRDGLDEAFALAANANIPVRIQVGRGATEAELRAAQQEAFATLDTPQLAGLGTDVTGGKVFLHVLAGTAYAEDPAGLAQRLEAEIGVPFTIEIVGSAGDD